MNIKELEQLLGIPRANIRFYEKEGLLNPARRENGYREYNEADVARLQRVMVLRKVGIGIADIKQILDGKLSLQQGIQAQISNLMQNIDEMENCLAICQKIEKDGISIDGLNDTYLNEIENLERSGQIFFSIDDDFYNFELNLMDSVWRSAFLINIKKYREKFGVTGYIVAILFICTIRGLISRKSGFWQGFSYPFLVFAIVSAIMLPIYLISKKNRKLANIIFLVVWVICVVFLLFIFATLAILILNHWLHFWF